MSHQVYQFLGDSSQTSPGNIRWLGWWESTWGRRRNARSQERILKRWNRKIKQTLWTTCISPLLWGVGHSAWYRASSTYAIINCLLNHSVEQNLILNMDIKSIVLKQCQVFCFCCSFLVLANRFFSACYISCILQSTLCKVNDLILVRTLSDGSIVSSVS